jgi:hypothetical protein
MRDSFCSALVFDPLRYPFAPYRLGHTCAILIQQPNARDIAVEESYGRSSQIMLFEIYGLCVFDQAAISIVCADNNFVTVTGRSRDSARK